MNTTKACVLYKMNTPVVYNKGTKWEKTCDTFLHSYAKSDAHALEMANELNKTATDRYYYVSRQEGMED